MRLGELVRWLLALAGATAIESYVTFETILTRRDFAYGAPIPVGVSHFESVIAANSSTFSWPLFIIDILIVAAIIAAATWRSGILGVVVASLVGLVALRLLPASQPSDEFPRWLAAMVTVVVAGVVSAPLARWRPRGARGAA